MGADREHGEASSRPLNAAAAEPVPLIMPGFRSLVAVYAIAFVSAMDDAIMLPTLYPFVVELCEKRGARATSPTAWPRPSFL